MKCKNLVVAFWKSDDWTCTYPARRLTFDKSNLPSALSDALEEATTCHANNGHCAAAIMIRKTMELLCNDQGAGGDNLKQRIRSLKEKLLIPRELLDAVDELRLLGNDAGHVMAKDFDQVTDEEVAVAFEFVTEILKAAYQYGNLLSKLRALKKDNEPEN